MNLIQITEKTYIEASTIVQITFNPNGDIQLYLKGDIDSFHLVGGGYIERFVSEVNSINKSSFYL